MTPTSSEDPVVELSEKHKTKVVKFICDIRNGKIEGSHNIALSTLSLLEQIIDQSHHATALELTNAVRSIGKQLALALPQELVAANMVRRVLRAIRDEHRAHCDQGGEGAGESLHRLVQASARKGEAAAEEPGAAPEAELGALMAHLAEVRAEVCGGGAALAAMAGGHAHAHELLLAHGHGRLAERFLRAAAAATRCRLLLAEGPDHKQSHAMASRLAAAGVSVTVINDAAVAGVMSRVNKVVLGVRAVLAGGALLARAGTRAVTAAAAHYCVPVIALAPLYKLSPTHACDHWHFDALAAPHHALPYGLETSGSAHAVSPRYDLVPPDHVTLFLTNLGGSSPSYIYRLLSELYDPNDTQF